MSSKGSKYYSTVETYYDQDASEFEARYWKNPVLQRIRSDFRTYVHRYPQASVLEIGFGSGLDLAHFSRIYPESNFFGIDISPAMVGLANDKVERYQLTNLRVDQGSVEDVSERFPDQKFDMIYVFFGALNTVEDLGKAADALNDLLTPNGKMVLTFVNKWYLGGMLIEFLKLRWRSAFGRLKTVWGGYSPTRHLASVCYSPAQIRKAFSAFDVVEQEGYSIVHPAWYYIRFNMLLRRKGRWLLWKVDKWLNGTPAWKWGEYSLFVMKKT